MSYTVKQVADETGISPHTIRYYLKEGLLPSVRKDARGIHRFEESDLENLYMIECMKGCGMTIAEMREYLRRLMQGDESIGWCLALFERKQADLAERRRRLEECERAVRYKVWYYRTAQEAGTLAIHSGMSADEVPPEMAEIRSGMRDVRRLR